jgi:copper chaperone
MASFRVMDMYSCRSVGAITKSVKDLDGLATVRVDMTRHWVDIDSCWAQERELGEAIGRAGFTPEAVSSAPPKTDLPRTVDLFLPME